MRFSVMSGVAYKVAFCPDFVSPAVYEGGYFIHDNTTSRDEWFPRKWRAYNVARYLNDYYNGVFHV